MMWKKFFEEFGKAFVFKQIRPYLRYHFSKAGIYEVPYVLFGILFFVTAAITVVSFWVKVIPWMASLELNAFQLFFGFFLSWLAIQGFLILIIILIGYSAIDLRIHARTANMEDKLQDYLQFVSENLKGGMSFEKALWAAVRPQFGVLSEEMKLAAKKVMTGSDIEEALSEFTHKYPSELLKRNFQLIIEGTKSGGEISDIIDRVVENLEELKELKGEIRATNLTYMIFIGFVVVVVAPMLFSLSFQFFNILSSFSSLLEMAQGVGVSGQSPYGNAFNIGGASIDIESFRQFSQGALIITGTSAGMMISIIQHGHLRASVRYIPLFVIISLILYFIFTNIGTSLFGGLFA
ncbi:MAG: type II secretion system F family protein [Nanoarchaeota archaeon]